MPNENLPAVLLVEDEALIRMGMAELLEAAGFAVYEAGDGLAGLSCLERHSDVAVLVTDIDLPRMDGLQLTEAARRMFPNLKVVLMSGKTYLRSNTLPLGVPFLEKPVSEAELVACVRNLISGDGFSD